MQKKFKMLIELVNQKETENGAIGVTESVKLMRAIGAVAKKHKFDCYAKWYPKEVIDYIPTGNTYELKTLEDIANLTSEQFEMLIEDLRSWCNWRREIKAGSEILEKVWVSIEATEWMTWLDTWLHEEKLEVQLTTSNKL